MAAAERGQGYEFDQRVLLAFLRLCDGRALPDAPAVRHVAASGALGRLGYRLALGNDGRWRAADERRGE